MQSLNFPYNARIDQIRWLAATIVFAYHFHLDTLAGTAAALQSPWWGLITEGHTGVGLFFTLSGFLFMQIALHQKDIVYGEFVRNRCLRILPLFLTIFLLATSIGRDKFQPQDVLYVLTTNLGLSPTSYTVITGAAWCISLEFMFYLIFPFLARFAMAGGPVYLLRLLGLMLVFKLAAFTVNDHASLMYFSTWVGRFDQFLIGMLAAMLMQRYAAAVKAQVAWLLPLAVLLAVGNSALQAAIAPFQPMTKQLFWITWSFQESAVWALFICAWVSLERPLPSWLEAFLNQGGKISFSFYLLHMALIHVVWKAANLVTLSGNRITDALLLALPTYGLIWWVAGLSYDTIELPFLRLRHRYGRAESSARLDKIAG